MIYDEDVYAGEAMVPYSARGSEVKLAYAKDLAIRCKGQTRSARKSTSVRLGKSDLLEDVRAELHTSVEAESDHDEAVRVIVELPKHHGWELDAGTAKPLEETSSFRRFALDVPPRGRASLEVVTFTIEGTRTQYSGVSLNALHGWTKAGLLAPQTATALGEILGLWNEAQTREAEKRRWDTARTEAYQKQTKIAEQLQVLKDGGPEGQLRLRYVKELEAEQDRVNAAERKMAELDEKVEAARRAAADKLAALVGKG